MCVSGKGHPPNGDRASGRRRSRNIPPVSDLGAGVGGEQRPGVTPTTPVIRVKFERIMEEILSSDKAEDLPAIMSKHAEFLLTVDLVGLTSELISEEPTERGVNMIRNCYEFMVTFLEEMVTSTTNLQKENQTLLREIVEAAKEGASVFDEKMKSLQDRFSYEFVKYLDGEVTRLEQGRSDGAEEGDLLGLVKIVRTRVCAEMDLMMGEDVAILTRMLSYDDRYMMRAALQAVLEPKGAEERQAFIKLVETTLLGLANRPDADLSLGVKLQDMLADCRFYAPQA
ncbi:unnamed protein product [Discosporangium mesarthrocarpum]